MRELRPAATSTTTSCSVDGVNRGFNNCVSPEPETWRPLAGESDARLICVSESNDDIAGRLGATHENVAFGWFVERLWSISYGPGNQTALAVVAYSGPA